MPKLGRSTTRDWTIEGAHLAERCQLFVIVALGETLLASGAALSNAKVWDGAILSALTATFLGTLAMWWLYFGTSSKDATQTITGSEDPGRIGAYFHYVHALLVAGIIATAVSNDLVLVHPHDGVKLDYALVLSGGPIVYLLGSAVYKKVVHGVIPSSHVAGIVLLIALVPLSLSGDLIWGGWLTTATMFAVACWEALIRGHRRQLD